VAAVHGGMKIWTMTFAIKSHNGMTLKFKLMSKDARAVSADVPSASRCMSYGDERLKDRDV
jgi:hypothetical protein